MAAYGEYHPRYTRRAQGSDRQDEAREQALQKVEDAHRSAGRRRSSSDPDRPRSLLLTHHRLHERIERFVGEGCSAFDDCKQRGPRPLLDDPAHERIERLVEEESPTEHGWLRSRWSCSLLAVHLFKERALLASRETLRRALHRLNFRWRRPRPVPPSKAPKQKRKRLKEVLKMLQEEHKASFFQDETKVQTNPKVGFCWMRKGKHKLLPTPGTNRKVWISGALNFATGRFHWVTGERKNDELFIKLLDWLRRTYRCHKQLHLAVDNDGSHTSKRVERYVQDSNGRRLSLHPLFRRGARRATRWS